METKQTHLRLKFLGAAREVTGSKTLASYKNKNILVDCGLYQGDKELRQLNWDEFPHAGNIDAVILTHAHIDHSGYLPRLVKQGFLGPIFCTRATATLVLILLEDSAHLEEEDAEFINRRGYSSHRPALPLFTMEDVDRVKTLIKTVDRDEWHQLATGLSFRFLRSGHILGSSFVQINFSTGVESKVLTFSGDLGSHRSNILKGPVNLTETDYLILEGTYGDKVHKTELTEETLAELIKKVYSRGGVLLIPAFAVGRTQDILFLINKLEEEKKIPKIPLYIDSPMALKATKIYTDFKDDLKLIDDGHKLSTSMEDAKFKATHSTQDSKNLSALPGPMIIISAAGMLTGGRILHHLKARLPDRKNAVLFTGHQAHGTKGRLLQNGIDHIQIHREEVQVEAEICSLEGLSGHADSREIIEWLKYFSKFPKKIFLNHGEKESLKALKYRIQNELGAREVEIPYLGEEIILE